MKLKIHKFISIFIGIILAFVLLEVGLRIYKFKKYSTDTLRMVPESRLIFEHRPSISFVNRHGVEIKYNSLGFIGEEVGPKTRDVIRILGVGDSIIAGEYLADNERYLNRVSNILSEKTDSHIELINAGVAGYNTWQELELLQVKGLSLEPDLIIVGICLNDDRGWRPELKKSWFGRITENPRHHKKARYFDFIYQKSEVYKFLYDGLYRAKRSFREKKNYYDDYEWRPDFQIWERPLRDMILLAKRHKIQILFVVFPLEQQILRGEKASFAPLAAFFEKEDVYFLDLIEYLSNKSGQALFLKQDPVHPNTLGTKIVAEATADYIIEKEILNK